MTETKPQPAPKPITEAMLAANPDFVQKVKRAAEKPGRVMSRDEFFRWLDQL